MRRPFSLAPRLSGEQRYLILENKVRIFEDMVHQDDKFAHDGGECDFGGFACRAEALVKLFEMTVGSSRHESRHVEGASNGRSSAPNGPAAMPLAAFSGMRSQTCQGGGLAAVKGSQFGQFSQHAQGGNGADASDGFELLDAFIEGRGVGAQFAELVFNLFQIAFQPTHEALSLPTQGRQSESFSLLTLCDQEVEQLHPATDQFGELLFQLGARRGGFGLQDPTIFSEEGRIDMIGLGALAGGTGEVPDPGGVQDTDRNVGLLQCGDDLAFVAAGGFTGDVNGVVTLEEFHEPPVGGRSVGQVMKTTGQMELQVLLGNIQARINSGHSVLAHSCKYELASTGRSINGSSLGHRDGRLLLPADLAKSQCQRVTNSPAPLSCRLQAAGQLPLPKPLFQDKRRGNLRYKRAGVRAGFIFLSGIVLKGFYQVKFVLPTQGSGPG